MDLNYSIIAIILVIAVVIIVILIKRNKKDQKDFEKSVNESELQPEEHKDVEPH